MTSSLFTRALRGLGLATEELKTPQQPGDLALAATALLLEVAWADHEVTEAELHGIRAAVKSTFKLSSSEIDELLDTSLQQHHDSVGVQTFTRALTNAWEEPQRFELVAALWRLAQADGQIHHYEEHSIRRIAELLYVSHKRFIEAKMVAKKT